MDKYKILASAIIQFIRKSKGSYITFNQQKLFTILKRQLKIKPTYESFEPILKETVILLQRLNLLFKVRKTYRHIQYVINTDSIIYKIVKDACEEAVECLTDALYRAIVYKIDNEVVLATLMKSCIIDKCCGDPR